MVFSPRGLAGSAAQPVPRCTEHHRGPRIGSPGACVSDQGWSENGGYELSQPLYGSGQSRVIQGNQLSRCCPGDLPAVLPRPPSSAAYLTALPGQLGFEISSGWAPVKAPAATALPRSWYSSQAVA